MEAVHSFETSVSFYQTTRRNIALNSTLRSFVYVIPSSMSECAVIRSVQVSVLKFCVRFSIPERVASPAHLNLVILGEDCFALSYLCCLLTFFKKYFCFCYNLCLWVITHDSVISSGKWSFIHS
jgi:hypothetical protein